MRHCPLCGTALVAGLVEGRERLRCPRCPFVHFLNPASAAAGVVSDGTGRVLLIRRAIEPARGDWALPAGYQEIDEHPRETVQREVREETGLEVVAEELFDLVFLPHLQRRPANLAVYLCRWISGEPHASDDASDARWFELDELPDNVAFENRERVLARLRANATFRSMNPRDARRWTT